MLPRVTRVLGITVLMLSLAAPALADAPVRPAADAVLPQVATEVTEVTASVLSDDEIPGIPVNWWGANVPAGKMYNGHVDTLAGDAYDVLQVQLDEGAHYRFLLSGISMDVDLYLYRPEATSLADTANIFASSTNSVTYPELIEGTIPSSGCWYIVMKAKGWTGYGLNVCFDSPDDRLPGIALGAQPQLGHLDSFNDWDDVGKVWLNAGDVIAVELDLGAVADPGFDPELYLYHPGTFNLDSPAVAWSEEESFPKTMAYLAEQSGYYSIDVYQTPGAAEQVRGDTSITWGIYKPVYRFYNVELGTHFYTADYAEALRVEENLWETYEFEGVGYILNPASNHVPLYRFFRPSTGTHFYTASEDEKNYVIATLPHLFQYEGPAYDVSSDDGGGTKPTVWRFYNRRTGTHFYTADPSERDNVINTLGFIYTLDGPAFYLGQ